jgi:glutaminase
VLLKTNPEKAKQLIETSIEIIEGKKIEPIFLASAFLEISHLTATLNDPRSRDFLRRAIELVEKIDYEPDVSAILLKTIETEVALAKLLNDNTMIKEAARLSERISREYYKTLAIKCISG